jgi:WD40 repeat protein
LGHALWDVKTGAESARLEGHSSRVTALCVLLDGRLASGSNDKTSLDWGSNAVETTKIWEGPMAFLSYS